MGTLFLLAAAIALLLTVENAFNQIWGVRRNRPFVQRVAMYLLILALGPLLLGVSLWAASYLFGVSLGLLGPLPKAWHFVLDLGPAALAWASLAALFFYLPNTRVRKRDAIVGGLLASAAIELGKRGFTAYLLKLPTYKAVYGSFAVIPLFLLWVHFSWLATLAAAMVTANLGRGITPSRASSARG